MRRSKTSQTRGQGSRQTGGQGSRQARGQTRETKEDPPSIDDTQDDEEIDPPSEYDDAEEGAISPSEEEESVWSQTTKAESSRTSKRVTKKVVAQSASPAIEDGSEIAEETDGEEEETLEEEPEVSESLIEHEKFDAVIKNSAEEIIVVPDKDRRTSHMMSLSEYTEAISVRTEQIATDGIASVMLDQIPPYLTTARDIAIAEMHARRCPLKLSRHVGRIVEGGVVKNFVEMWSPNVMTHPLFQ